MFKRTTLFINLGLLLGMCASLHAQTSVESDFGLNDQPGEQQAYEPQQLIFHGAPVTITLSAGVERRILFDGPFEISLDAKLPKAQQAAFKPQMFGDNLLLTVDQPFSTRLVARLLSDGEEIPIDLRVITEPADTNPIAIVRQSVLDARTQLSKGDAQPVVPAYALHNLDAQNTTPGYVDMIRYAAQRMYAPERYLDAIPGSKEVDLNHKKPVQLMRFDAVSTRPVLGWSVGGLFISAIEVRNIRDRAIELDPRLLIGNWRAASFHHNRIGPAESRFERTMLYLISDRPFTEALGLKTVASRPKQTKQEADHAQK